jgi:uncharacterized protein (DUF1778 family)
VLTSVQDALGAIEEHHQFVLSVPDSEAFVHALLRPKPVNDRLRDTVCAIATEPAFDGWSAKCNGSSASSR